MKEKILPLRAKVSRIVPQEDYTMVTPLMQVQMGQVAKVPTIAVHVATPNPPNVLTVSVAPAAASLGHGASR